LEAREQWLKDNGRKRKQWEGDYRGYMEHEVKSMMIDDFVDKFAAHLKKLLQSYTY
jgi:hypothetical protein